MGSTSPIDQGPKKQIDYFLIAILLASVALVFYLLFKPAHAPWTQPRTASVLPPGSMVQPITANSMSGDREIIDYRNYDKPTVIYVFSPNCVWCARNTQNINALVSQKAEAFHFIGVSLSEAGLDNYLNSHRLNFPTYKNVAPESLQMLGLGATPQTIVISRNGRVLKNWIGAFSVESQAEIEEFFDIELPGLDLRQNLN